MRFRVVIPARFASTRLPGKVLLPIMGRPMLQWVHERASAAGAEEVLIATDDARIAMAARGFGAVALLTASSHPSGSDRIAEVAAQRAWKDDEIVVNVQADEPLLPVPLIAQVASALAAHRTAQLATLRTPIGSRDEFLDSNVVKVVTDVDGRALYFSRAPLPWQRDALASGGVGALSLAQAMRHVGLYAYRVAALRRLSALPPSALEVCERLEQLRALENGMEIRVATACEPPGPDVNSAADLERVIALMGGSLPRHA